MREDDKKPMTALEWIEFVRNHKGDGDDKVFVDFDSSQGGKRGDVWSTEDLETDASKTPEDDT